MAQVFLSYSRKDTDIMVRVRGLLEREGISVWTDEGIEAGTRSWKVAIEDAIKQARCIVCILSPDAEQSRWVREELDFAETHQRQIFLLLARGSEETAIPFGFSTHQWVDIRAGDEAITRRLLPVLRQYLAAPPAVKPAAPPVTAPQITKRSGLRGYVALLLGIAAVALIVVFVLPQFQSPIVTPEASVTYTLAPTDAPTGAPTGAPSLTPTLTDEPTVTPSITPTERATLTAAQRQFHTRVRPLQLGYSMTGGVIGVRVRDAEGAYYLIGARRTDLRDAPVLQPGESGGGQFPDDVIGYYVPTTSQATLMRLLALIRLDETVEYRDRITSTDSPRLGERVTLMTNGYGEATETVSLINATVNVQVPNPNYDELVGVSGMLILTRDELTPIFQGGMVYTDDGVVGYIVGMSNLAIIVAPIETVLDLFDVELVSDS
ncbi:MAG: TIR domain-containing protein [Anaerolinea sp.]|nr:TIR domain-containing protein [Anaerolinea sp.]